MKTLFVILLLSVSMLAQDKTTATLAAQVPFPFQANTPYVAGALVTNGGSTAVSVRGLQGLHLRQIQLTGLL